VCLVDAFVYICAILGSFLWNTEEITASCKSCSIRRTLRTSLNYLQITIFSVATFRSLNGAELGCLKPNTETEFSQIKKTTLAILSSDKHQCLYCGRISETLQSLNDHYRKADSQLQTWLVAAINHKFFLRCFIEALSIKAYLSGFNGMLEFRIFLDSFVILCSDLICFFGRLLIVTAR
jgi:hypothetical protein